MKVHYAAVDSVHGGPIFEGPKDESLSGTEEECGAVMIAFSFRLQSWVIADHQGNVYAEGIPSELSIWLQEYCTELTNLEAEILSDR